MELHKNTVVYTLTGAVLASQSETDSILEKLSTEIKTNKQIMIDLRQVDSLPEMFAEHFFGTAAAECIVEGVVMEFKFPDEHSVEMSRIIVDAIRRTLPPSLGGNAAVH